VAVGHSCEHSSTTQSRTANTATESNTRQQPYRHAKAIMANRPNSHATRPNERAKQKGKISFPRLSIIAQRHKMLHFATVTFCNHGCDKTAIKHDYSHFLSVTFCNILSYLVLPCLTLTYFLGKKKPPLCEWGLRA